MLLALALPALAGTSTEIGTSRAFGLGLVLGAPAGVTGKVYFDSAHALEFTAAAWAGGPWGWDDVYGHLVYLWHPSVVARQAGYQMPWHIGVGGFVTDGGWGWGKDDDDWTHGGARFVVGLDLNLTRAPVQFFGDIGVNAALLPSFGWDGTVGAGARYYF